MSDLAATVAARLQAAGFAADDPSIVALREWNRAAGERQLIRVELRRGQFGQTRQVRLDEVSVILVGNTAEEVRAWLARTSLAPETPSANDKTGRAECTQESVPKWAGVLQKKSRGRGQHGPDRSGGR